MDFSNEKSAVIALRLLKVMNTEQYKKIEHFFNEHVPAKEFAVCMRKFMYRALLKYLSTEETECNDDFSSGYYWLTEFLEAIDPQLK